MPNCFAYWVPCQSELPSDVSLDAAPFRLESCSVDLHMRHAVGTTYNDLSVSSWEMIISRAEECSLMTFWKQMEKEMARKEPFPLPHQQQQMHFEWAEHARKKTCFKMSRPLSLPLSLSISWHLNLHSTLNFFQLWNLTLLEYYSPSYFFLSLTTDRAISRTQGDEGWSTFFEHAVRDIRSHLPLAWERHSNNDSLSHTQPGWTFESDGCTWLTPTHFPRPAMVG